VAFWYACLSFGSGFTQEVAAQDKASQPPQDSSPGLSKKKLPVPDPAALKESERLLREVFKEDFNKVTPADIKALAVKLLDKAFGAGNEPSLSFTMLRDARDLAASICDLETSFKATDQMEERFEVDSLLMKGQVLDTASRRLPTPEAAKGVMEAYLGVIDEAVRQDKADFARATLSKAESVAKGSKIPSLLNQVKAKGIEVEKLLKDNAALKSAEKLLVDHPEDPAANLTVGKHLCFIKGAWEKGLPYLGKSSDPALGDVARRDMGKVELPQSQLEIGDSWFQLADKATLAAEKKGCQIRAAYWYQLALPSLSGLNQLKTEKRLEDIQRSLSLGAMVDLLKLIDPSKDTAEGRWSMSGTVLSCLGVASTLNIPYVPPEEYDLKLTVERKEGNRGILIGIVDGGHQATIVVDEQGDCAGLARVDGMRMDQGGTMFRGVLLAKDTECTLICEIRKMGVTFRANGKMIFEWKGEPQRLSRNPALPILRPDTLFLVCNDHMLFKQVSLLPLTGEGKKAR